AFRGAAPARSLWKHPHIHPPREPDQPVHRTPSEPLPDARPLCMPDEHLCDSPRPGEIHQRFNRIVAVEDLDARAGGAGDCELAIERRLVRGGYLRLIDVCRDQLAVKTVGYGPRRLDQSSTFARGGDADEDSLLGPELLTDALPFEIMRKLIVD